jgi:capsular polysaccharide biosynthesis protein
MSKSNETNNTSYNFDLTDVVLFLVKNFKKLAILCAVAAILTYIFTMPSIIQPLYGAKASFYPGTTNSVSSQLFYSIKEKAKDPLAFADLEVTEQYLQLLHSDALKFRIINQYALYDHYGIDRSNKFSGQKMNKYYSERITIRRTDFNSIEILVKDHNPDTAAAIANGIMYTVDQMKKDMQGIVAKQVFAIVEKSYQDKLLQVDSIKTRLKELGKEGVYDLANQAKGISEISGKGQSNKYTDNEKTKLGMYGGEVSLLNQMLEEEALNLTFLRTKYEQAQIDLNANMSNIFVIDYAGPSWDKVYPKRAIMLITSVIITFFAGCVVILGLQQFHKIKHLLK